MEPEFKLNVIWEGELPLGSIKWNENKNQEFQLSSYITPKIKSCWDDHLKENPNDYDGSLIFLEDFQFKDNHLFLDTSYIKFSTVTYMEKHKFHIEKGVGVLGVQYLLMSPKKEYILVGKRSLSGSYFPGAMTIPGGILEIDDLSKLPKEAFMREAYEEINLPIKPDGFLIAIIAGFNNISVTFLISINLIARYKFNPNQIIKAEENEWEGSLKWISIESLKSLKTHQLLDGLVYFRSKSRRIYD
ncbi:MAG: NUDIX hydrolase [Candidatus Thorarchaeota archaeon]